jgi:hypothetical protein
MAYSLGAVKPHVKNAANHFGPKHGIRTVYGWRPTGSVPNSDHPKGLALDFMTSNRSVGDTLAADAIANASAWDITYVIWYRRIWTRESGQWAPYSGPSPHIDHVHVSFGTSRGSGIETVPVGGNPLIPDWLEQLKTAAFYVETGFKWLAEPGNWARIGMFSGGFIICLVALIGWKAMSTNISKVSKYARP